jgi:hypothetical protein
MTAPEGKTVDVETLRHHALRIFTLEQLQAMDRIPRKNFVFLREKRLLRDGRPPTDAELEGIAELAIDHLWHPATGRM